MQRTVPVANDEILIDQMTEHDLLEVVEIEETSGLSRWGWSAYYAELQTDNSALMLVARVAGRRSLRNTLAGYIVARTGSEELHINNVAVRDEYRRRGIGRELLTQVIDTGKKRGAVSAFLELRAGNSAARALYEQCGFRVTATRSRYYSDPVEDAFVMMVDLK